MTACWGEGEKTSLSLYSNSYATSFIGMTVNFTILPNQYGVFIKQYGERKKNKTKQNKAPDIE